MSHRLEVASLRSELQALRALLDQLDQRVSALEESAVYEVVDSPPPAVAGAAYGAVSGRGSASLSSSARAPASPVRSASAEVATAFPDGSSEVNPGAPTSQYRLQVAEGVGRFLARALAGQARGTSGRDRLSLASRLYIVCRNARGETYSVPLVLNSFARVKELCFVGGRGSDPGESIFVGLPSQAEVRFALSAAGLPCPDLRGNGRH